MVSKSKMPKCSTGAAPSWLVWGAVLVVATLAFILAWMLIRRYIRPSTEAFAETKPSDKVVFLYMNGCGWCTKFEPTWEEFSSKAAPKLGVETFKFERAEDGAKQYMSHVEGFPTILFVNGTTGHVTVFEGERTIEGLTAFVKKESTQVPPADADNADKATTEPFDEPTEFGKIFNSVAASKSSVDDGTAHLDKKIRDNAGGKVESTSKVK